MKPKKWHPDASFSRNKTKGQQEKWHCDDNTCWGMPSHVWHGIQMKHGKPVRLTGDGQSNLIMNPEPAAADDQNNIFQCRGRCRVCTIRPPTKILSLGHDQPVILEHSLDKTSTPNYLQPSHLPSLCYQTRPRPPLRCTTLHRLSQSTGSPCGKAPKSAPPEIRASKITRKKSFRRETRPHCVWNWRTTSAQTSSTTTILLSPRPGLAPKPYAITRWDFQKKLVFEGSKHRCSWRARRTWPGLSRYGFSFQDGQFGIAFPPQARRQGIQNSSRSSQITSASPTTLRASCLRAYRHSILITKNLQQKHPPRTKKRKSNQKNYDHLEEDGVFRCDNAVGT